MIPMRLTDTHLNHIFDCIIVRMTTPTTADVLEAAVVWGGLIQRMHPAAFQCG